MMLVVTERNVSDHPSIAAPSLVSLLVCDQVIDDKLSNKKSAIGLFNSVLVPSVPTRIHQLAVMATLTEISGRTPLQLRLMRDEDNSILMHTNGHVDAPNPLAMVDLKRIIVTILGGPVNHDFSFHMLSNIGGAFGQVNGFLAIGFQVRAFMQFQIDKPRLIQSGGSPGAGWIEPVDLLIFVDAGQPFVPVFLLSGAFLECGVGVLGFIVLLFGRQGPRRTDECQVDKYTDGHQAQGGQTHMIIERYLHIHYSMDQ